MEFDQLSRQAIGAAIRVHRKLGPGLFEDVYKVCLKYELERLNLHVISEVTLPVNYDGINLELGYRIDLLVENTLIIELKSVFCLGSRHKAQLLTYLRLAKKDLGLLINFNTTTLKEGIVRVVNNYSPSRPSRLRVNK